MPLLGYAAELFGLTSAAKHRRQLTAPNADLLVSKEAAEDEHSLPPYGPPYNDDSVIAKQASLVVIHRHYGLLNLKLEPNVLQTHRGRYVFRSSRLMHPCSV